MSHVALTASSPAIGWYGKLPVAGDFVTRRLDGIFVGLWDEWLSAGLDHLRAHNEAGWQSGYLNSPTWCFLLTPGFLPAPLDRQVWVGVVMPSVDRVGRYYPLTLAYPLAEIPMTADARSAMWSWLRRLEDAAVYALQQDWPIDTFDAELQHIGLAQSQGCPTVALPASIDAFFSTAEVPGRCVWYCDADLNGPDLFFSSARDPSVARLWK